MSAPDHPASPAESGWIVRVYRLSTRDPKSWERMSARNSQGKRVTIRAIPQKGSIFLPKIRSKICLFNKTASSGSSSTSVSAAAPVLIRRRRTILVRGRGGRAPRTLVLSFRNDRDCLCFSDCLVRLNPRQPSAGTEDGATASKNSVGAHPSRGGRRSGSRALAPEWAEEDGKSGDVNTATTQRRDTPSSTSYGFHSNPSATREEEVESYVARLLVDHDFDEYTRSLEACIASRPHLRALLDAAVEEP